MNLLAGRDHALLFRVNIEQIGVKDKWFFLKHQLESNVGHFIIIQQARDRCKLEQNRVLSLLNCAEGGIGGNTNTFHKQIRPRSYFGEGFDDIDIVLDVYNTDNNGWTYEELDDMIHAFEGVLDNIMGQEGVVTGCIEIEAL